MGIGASTEVLTEDEINKEEDKTIKKERSRSKSKKGKKRSKSRSGRSSTKSKSRRRSSKSSKRADMEERERNTDITSKEEKKNSSKASEMKRKPGGTLEERGVLAGASKKMGKEKTEGRNTSKEGKKNSSKKMGKEKMAGNAAGNLEERQVLALESVADSMEALVRTSLITMMTKLVMEKFIKVQLFKL